MLKILLMVAVLLASSLTHAHEANALDGIAPSADQIRPILLGSAMPDVALETADGKATTLKGQVRDKPAVVIFYRGGWCPFCNTQLSELRKIQKPLEDLGYRMIAISPDLPAELTKTLGKDELGYTLLSDSKAAALRAFGIGFRVDDATIAKYQTYNIDLEKASGATHHALPVPSVFIVDKDGVLQFSYSHPDYKIRVPGKVVLAAAQAIADRAQYVKPKR